MLCNISLCRYFRDSVGLSLVYFLLVASIVFLVVWGGGGIFHCASKVGSTSCFK